MKIQFQTNNFKSFSQSMKNNENKNNVSMNSNRESMPYATAPNAYHPSLVSFGMNASELTPIVQACAKKLNAPLEKFKNIDELNTWAREEFARKTDLTQYKNKDTNVEEAVHSRLGVWRDYLKGDYSLLQFAKPAGYYRNDPVLSTYIFDAMAKGISPDSHELPPHLNPDTLCDQVNVLIEKFTKNPDADVDFKKLYNKQSDFGQQAARLYENGLLSQYQDLGYHKFVTADGMAWMPEFVERQRKTLADIGSNVNELFENVKLVKGNVDLRGIKLDSFGNCESIGKNLYIDDANISGSIKVGGKVYVNDVEVDKSTLPFIKQ